MRLEVNAKGAWRALFDIPPDRLAEVRAAAGLLAAEAGDNVRFAILTTSDDHPIGKREYVSPNLLEGGRCFVCGCTSYDCVGCSIRTGEGCTWVNQDETLCSACAGGAS